MKSIKTKIISIVLATGIALAAQIGFAQGMYADEYSTHEFADEMCFDAPESCENIGDAESFCGEAYLCAAAGPLAAGDDDPTFRECIDGCFADSIRAKQACDADYASDLRWCDRNARPGFWRDTCYYLAGQTRNLCYTAAAADLTGCLSGCGIGGPVKGIWKKIAK